MSPCRKTTGWPTKPPLESHLQVWIALGAGRAFALAGRQLLHGVGLKLKAVEYTLLEELLDTQKERVAMLDGRGVRHGRRDGAVVFRCGIRGRLRKRLLSPARKA